ncbi:4'-phosphopantetheinyl transferase superfamily protein [Ramlibacter sp. XY19]|uniref:4'-phosphopantetheinyl transferase family protein n=1 Tax=Ramlibacter paludis TaxID=2908000 RepID=UPI0023DB1828|nr:4'-phosphopantetheinyl transferase superfamily protein [Ramlibacter paludis]MCG2594674.1 4'-phosphopantetheinyl transferase superfamily protein [Ramlibacter paludis]
MTVHIACGAVDALLAGSAEGWLSASEQARLVTFTSAKRRDQFTAARWQARRLLAQVLGGEPADWPLEAPHDAPPRVATRADLFLSISHSGGWTACALSSSPVGLDLEAPQRQRDIAGLMDLCCTPAERAFPEAMFYELWTVKEAWLKRRGEWIAPRRLQQLEATPDVDGELRTWRSEAWWLALCAQRDAVQWWTPAPVETRNWRLVDRAGVATPAYKKPTP